MIIFLFDIDGTLILSGGAGKAALEGAMASEFGFAKALVDVPLSGRTDRAIARDLLLLHGLDDSPENLRRLLESYLQHLPETLARGNGCILPGISQLLATLGQRTDVQVGLLTGNVQAGARVKLGHFGLCHHFAFGGYGDQHLCRNDVAREALAEVHSRMNGSVQPERIWVIGDTPLDIRCARAIGARVAAVATGWHSLDELAADQPDLLLTDLSDPRPLLDRCG